MYCEGQESKWLRYAYSDFTMEAKYENKFGTGLTTKPNPELALMDSYASLLMQHSDMSFIQITPTFSPAEFTAVTLNMDVIYVDRILVVFDMSTALMMNVSNCVMCAMVSVINLTVNLNNASTLA